MNATGFKGFDVGGGANDNNSQSQEMAEYWAKSKYQITKAFHKKDQKDSKV